jgi:hypothetical protein
MPVREEAEFVPRIVEAGFADIIGIGGLSVLCFFDEEPEECGCLVNFFFIPNGLSYAQ